jgi:hypothetical protein
MADDARKKELLAQEISKEELDILEKDFEYCRKLKSRHFDKDLQKVLDEVNEVLNFLQTQHLIELNLEKYYIEGETDPKALEDKLNGLRKLLVSLYQDEIEKALGQIDITILPKRKNLIKEYVAQLGQHIIDPAAIEDCDRLLIGGVGRCLEICREIKVIISHNKSGEREKVRQEIQELRPKLNSFIEILLRLLNQIMYVDSVIQQLKTEVYDIEHNLMREFALRHLIWQMLENTKDKGWVQVGVSSYTLYVVSEAGKQDFLATKPGANIGKEPFDENKVRLGKNKDGDPRPLALKKFFFNVQRKPDDFHTKFYEELPPDLKAPEKAGDAQLEDLYRKMFFNEGQHYIAFTDHNGAFNPCKDAEDFFMRILPLLMFDRFKGESFDKMINSIVEPFFLGLSEKMEFRHYDSAGDTSWKITQKILEHQRTQGDITDRDQKQISSFMEQGYAALKSAQEGVISLRKEGIKTPKYSNFVDRPYLVHQLMMDILRLAIFSEARAKVNEHNTLIYTGRESGFEGSNTVAVHGYNNYMKYQRMLQVVVPKLDDELRNIFDHFEHFKGWVIMGLHDAATYDRDNAISFGSQGKYGNNNKKAHKLVGGYVIREQKMLKKLFNVENDDGAVLEMISGEDGKLVENAEKKELELLATIVSKHDEGTLWLDPSKISGDSKFKKQLVLISLSGLADNSAGIGMVDEHGHVHVDPWEEKGSSVFVVPSCKPGELPSNGEIMFDILAKLSNDPKYFKTHDAEWKNILAIIKMNVEAYPERAVRDKLLKGLADKEFSDRSATSTAGILNCGYMELDNNSYDGKTLKMKIVLDKEIMAKLGKIFGDKKRAKFLFDRLGKFSSEYRRSLKNLTPPTEDNDDSALIQDLNSKRLIEVWNCNEKGEKMDTVGLSAEIVEESGIMTKSLIEDASKQLLTDLHKYHDDRYEKKE